MRVIGGTFGGRRLRALDGQATRPTSERVREALFSRLEARYGLDGASVLDVFAGTGALAIEAMSRGAARATCIEMEKRALGTLRDNLADLGLQDAVRVKADDYRRVLARLAARDLPGVPRGATRSQASPAPLRPRRFDGVFLDPPYGKGLADEALREVARLGLLKPGGWVVVEVGRREALPAEVPALEGTLVRVREDVYGDTMLALYEARAAGQPGVDAKPAVEAGRGVSAEAIVAMEEER